MRKPSRLALVALVLSAGFAVVSYVLAAANIGTLHGATASWNGIGETTTWVFLMGFASVLGLLVARKQPDNTVWAVFALGGLLGMVSLAGDHYAGYALVTRPGAIPGGMVARFISMVAFAASWFVAGVLLPAVFPSGHVVSRRWRPAVWIGAIGAAGWGSLIFSPKAFTDDGLLGDVDLRNPIAIDFPPLTAFADLAILLLFAGMFLGIISLVVRTVRVHGDERQQIKVVAYTIAITTVVQLLVANLNEAVRLPAVIWLVVGQAGVAAIPLSIAVALLRYRLYDVDRLINRTIVYVVVMSVLGGLYAGVVILLSTATRGLARSSDLAVAATTLLIFGLFVPVRRGVQRFVDRRFYRTRYDAARTLEAFAARLREQTDLDTLGGEIRRVAVETMRPAHVGLWMPGDVTMATSPDRSVLVQ